MGQRHQYLIVYPKYVNKNWPDNGQEACIEVIHHQWLYGRGAIHALDRVLTLIKNNVADGNDYNFGTQPDGSRLMGDGTHAIAAAMSVDPSQGYFHRVHIFEEKFPMGTLKTSDLDNNDGVTVIEFVPGQAKPNVCFASPSYGVEGSHGRNDSDKASGPWSPAEYLSFYYTDAEQQAWKLDGNGKPDAEGVEVYDGVHAALARIAENSNPIPKARLKKILKGWKFGK